MTENSVGPEPTHDPGAAATELSAKLASRSRHVCFLFGAGTSCAAGLPAVQQLLEDVLASLEDEVRSRAEQLYEGRNLEQGLTRLRRIRGLLAGDDTFDGLTVASAEDLETAITNAVIARLSANDLDLGAARNFASWATGDFYARAIEVFTVNYDLLIERGFEDAGVPYFDGFVGSLAARFREDLVDAQHGAGEPLPRTFVRLWKLHGSLNWEYVDERRRVVRRGGPTNVEGIAAIYPSDEKYDRSRRVPFVVLHDRFRRALAEPETLTLISGYSFGDDHLNDVIFDAARRYPRSEIVTLFRSSIPSIFNDLLLPNLTVLAATEAIIGGERRKWAAPVDSDSIALLWKDKKFLLGDFSHFSRFMARGRRGASVDPSQPLGGGGSGD